MNHCVLIGGGSGLIGTRLTEILLQKGHDVRHLGRKAKDGIVKTFQWTDQRAFEGVTTVINLAGANINGHRWTKSYKQEILTSRTMSTKLIVDFLNTKQHSVRHFLSGSAIGYYGIANNPKSFLESDPPGSDYMANVVKAWEHEATQVNPKVKLAIVRTGIVISEEGGAIEEMSRPIKLFVGAPLGSGRQIISWIHLEDICGIFMHIIENNLAGVFNGVAPEPASNEEITKVLAKKLHRPLWLPNIPGFVLRVILGEMSDAVLNGSRVSSQKIQEAGFRFQFPTLDEALTRNPKPETRNPKL